MNTYNIIGSMFGALLIALPIAADNTQQAYKNLKIQNKAIKGWQPGESGYGLEPRPNSACQQQRSHLYPNDPQRKGYALHAEC